MKLSESGNCRYTYGGMICLASFVLFISIVLLTCKLLMIFAIIKGRGKMTVFQPSGSNPLCKVPAKTISLLLFLAYMADSILHPVTL